MRGFSSLDLTGFPDRAVEALENPRVLTDETAMNALRYRVSPHFTSLFEGLIVKARGILAHSTEMVFVVAAATMLIAVIAGFVLDEVPFKKHEQKESEI